MTLSPPAAMLALTLALALSSTPAAAGPPTEQLRDGMERIVKALGAPNTGGGDEAVQQRQTSVTRIASEVFDFGEMSKRTLGRHWDRRTPTERQHFTRLFTELIQRSYFSKIDEYGSEKTVFRGETMEGDDVVVRTKLVLAHGAEMPLDYSMHNVTGRWRVYDLSIDGVSLVANYRAQFHKIIRASSYEDLVAKFKSNQAESSGPAAAPPGRKP